MSNGDQYSDEEAIRLRDEINRWIIDTLSKTRRALGQKAENKKNQWSEEPDA